MSWQEPTLHTSRQYIVINHHHFVVGLQLSIHCLDDNLERLYGLQPVKSGGVARTLEKCSVDVGHTAAGFGN